tara:strand:- start:814 stop:2400 length:1587 start_codon:yes stop_codon:yes gene_type:complete
MKWIGQNIYDQISKFRNTVDFSEDVTFYQPVNNANPGISIGSSDDERLLINVNYKGTTTQEAQIVNFKTFTESGTAHDGRFDFLVDETRILKIQDDGINLEANMGLIINDVDIITDSSGTATLSNIDALDATTISTLNSATSLGTLTALTVDNIGINGDTITASGDLEIVATGNDISVDTDNFVIASAFSTKPFLELRNTTSDNKGSFLQFTKDKGAAGADGDTIGIIDFMGDNADQAQTRFVRIQAQVSEADNSDEAGKLALTVANDGTLRNGITMEGSKATAAEVDVTIANGAASVTTLAGTLTMGSTATINNSGVVQVAAQTVIDHDQLANFAAGEHFTQANITTVGTIGTGVWQGTAIASNQQKHLMHYQFLGYTTGNGSDFEMPQALTDGQAPFEHADTSSSDGLTIPAGGGTNQSEMIRMGGQLMINASTLKKWTGIATNANNKELTIGLFKWTPSDNSAGDMTPTLLEEIVIDGKGNDLTRTFATTNFDATVAVGDIIFTQMKTETSGNVGFFNSTLEVEF